jgi:hypothetical protein
VLLFAVSLTSAAQERLKSTKLQEFEAWIQSELPVGANSEAIEAFLQRHDFPYKFDPIFKRYQSFVRNVSADPEHVVAVFLYVDEYRNFSKPQLQDVYAPYPALR